MLKRKLKDMTDDLIEMGNNLQERLEPTYDAKFMKLFEYPVQHKEILSVVIDETTDTLPCTKKVTITYTDNSHQIKYLAEGTLVCTDTINQDEFKVIPNDELRLCETLAGWSEKEKRRHEKLVADVKHWQENVTLQLQKNNTFRNEIKELNERVNNLEEKCTRYKTTNRVLARAVEKKDEMLTRNDVAIVQAVLDEEEYEDNPEEESSEEEIESTPVPKEVQAKKVVNKLRHKK